MFNGDGVDYSPAFGVPGASYMADLPDGTRARKYLDTGENPPNGAIFYYWLNGEAAKSPVSFQVHDNNGRIIARCDGSDKNSSDNRKPLSKSGLNRFVWDLTEAAPIRLDKSLKDQKYEPFSKGGNGPAGVVVKPGKYQVTMTIGDITKTQSLRVLKDPRINTSDADFTEQHDLASRILGKLSELNIAVNRIRLMKQQLKNIYKIMPEQTPLADDLLAKLTTIEALLVDTKRETPRDVLRHPAGLDDTLENLLSVVTISDSKPPAQTKEVADDVFNKVDVLLSQLDVLVNGAITDFNSVIANASPPAISGSSISALKTGW